MKHWAVDTPKYIRGLKNKHMDTTVKKSYIYSSTGLKSVDLTRERESSPIKDIEKTKNAYVTPIEKTMNTYMTHKWTSKSR